MDSRKTGELIKEIRIEKNMKQKDLADRLFVSVAAVSKWENGHGFPDVSVLPDLCRILDLSIEEFMKGERNSMENKQNTVIDDVVEIAGHQQKQRKNLLRALSLNVLMIAVRLTHRILPQLVKPIIRRLHQFLMRKKCQPSLAMAQTFRGQ